MRLTVGDAQGQTLAQVELPDRTQHVAAALAVDSEQTVAAEVESDLPIWLSAVRVCAAHRTTVTDPGTQPTPAASEAFGRWLVRRVRSALWPSGGLLRRRFTQTAPSGTWTTLQWGDSDWHAAGWVSLPVTDAPLSPAGVWLLVATIRGLDAVRPRIRIRQDTTTVATSGPATQTPTMTAAALVDSDGTSTAAVDVSHETGIDKQITGTLLAVRLRDRPSLADVTFTDPTESFAPLAGVVHAVDWQAWADAADALHRQPTASLSVSSMTVPSAETAVSWTTELWDSGGLVAVPVSQLQLPYGLWLACLQVRASLSGSNGLLVARLRADPSGSNRAFVAADLANLGGSLSMLGIVAADELQATVEALSGSWTLDSATLQLLRLGDARA